LAIEEVRFASFTFHFLKMHIRSALGGFDLYARSYDNFLLPFDAGKQGKSLRLSRDRALYHPCARIAFSIEHRAGFAD
jgi:hypothetical protein